MELAEIKYAQLTNQHLTAAVNAETAARDLCGFQAQFLKNAHHALSIRSRPFDDVIWNEFAKSWTNRGTMHIFLKEDLPLFLHEGRKRFLRSCDTFEAEVCISQKRKAYFAEYMLEQIDSGNDTRDRLKEACMVRGMTEAESESLFNPWGGLIRALCEAGKIAYKVQEKKAFFRCSPFEPMDQENAERELLNRYFTHYGPATLKDAAYFFGVPQTKIKQVMRKLSLQEVSCGGKVFYSTEKVGPPDGTLPGCLFLSGFDPLLLGYEKKESLYLPSERIRQVFTLSGIVRPVLLMKGRILGTWKRQGRNMQIEPFNLLSAAEKAEAEEKVRTLWPDIKNVKIGT